jgi:hypothetical protein
MSDDTQAERGTDPTFAAEAFTIICAFVPFPREPRALGPIFIKAQRAGLIEPTGAFHRTTRPSAHRSPQREWRPTAAALAQKSGAGRRGNRTVVGPALEWPA